MIKKAETIALLVHDLDRCTTFYRDTIALPLKGSDPGLAAFDLSGGLMLVLLSPQGAAEVLGTDASALKLEGEPRGYISLLGPPTQFTTLSPGNAAFLLRTNNAKPIGLSGSHATEVLAHLD